MSFRSKYTTINAAPYVANSSIRTQAITGVTIHHCASTNFVGSYQWLQQSTGSSANFMISQDGKNVAQIVPAERASWANANYAKNHSTITFELTNSTGAPSWQVSEATIQKLILMLVEIANHYGWKKYTRGVNFFLHSEVSQLGTSCPGPYVTPKADEIVARTNAILSGASPAPEIKVPEKTSTTLYQAKVTANVLNVRNSPSLSGTVIDSFQSGQVVNVEEEKDSWLRISQKYPCWIHSDYVQKITTPSTYKIIVTGDVVNVRTNPSTNSKIHTQVKRGEVFTVVDDSDRDFYKIKSGYYISKAYTQKL